MPEPANFLYRIQPTRLEMLTGGPTPEEAAIVDEHFAYLEALTQQGVVALAGRTLITGPESFGIILFRADSPDAAHDLVANDPAVKGGVMRAELFPFRVSLAGELAAEA
jgi:uncharacterized protein YciI